MDKQGGSQTIDCTTPNVVFTKERADKARETLREKLEKLSLTEIEDLDRLFSMKSRRESNKASSRVTNPRNVSTIAYSLFWLKLYGVRKRDTSFLV